jgi:general secretion pathway protein A
MIGEIGTGKTALINYLVEMMKASVIVAKVPDPGLDTLEFFNFLAVEFKMNKRFDSKGAFLIHLKKFLLKAYSLNQKVLLIIDEAQRLNHELLEQIRLLSNIELDNRKLINIFFVGQTEFSQFLLEERNRAVRQRITINYHIKPLTESETRAYIKHRLKIAGATREIFSKDAVHEIFSFSAGYPRRINIICDHALLTGYVSRLKSIDRKVIQECEKELQIPLDTGIEDQIDDNESTAHLKKPDPPIPTNTSRRKRTGTIGAIVVLLILGISFFTSQETNDDSHREENEAATRRHKIPLPQKTPKKDDTTNQVSEATNVETTKDAPLSDNSARNQTPVLQKEKASATDINQPANADEMNTQVQEANRSEGNREKIVSSNPPEAPLPVERRLIIYFKRNSNELPDETYEALNNIANLMLKTPSATLDIKGYSDSTGSFNYNQKISQFRANTIKIYMVDKGVDPGKIKTAGLGSQNPLASNETAEGRRQNRRVELTLDFNDQN